MTQGYTMYVDGVATCHGAAMTPEEAEHTNATQPPGMEWRPVPPPHRDTCFDVLRITKYDPEATEDDLREAGILVQYRSHDHYNAAMESGEMNEYRRRSVEYRKSKDQVEKAA